ncbi:lipid body membrane protein [Canna indica]|uniref:Lipid body membrane protein n=1 Tax=Canna indica TaxID=4628 RepID=A0AAQ3Q0L0_9LILI|nr:lipid body membrane protein [Canna indica]
MGNHDRHTKGEMKSLLPENGCQALAVATLLPVGGGFLALAGFTLVGSMIGLAALTPLFLLFSPVLVPAVLLVALAVGGFLTSGAFGLAGLSSLGYLLKHAREWAQNAPQQIEDAKRRVGEAAGQMGQKAKEAGQAVRSRLEETRT